MRRRWAPGAWTDRLPAIGQEGALALAVGLLVAAWALGKASEASWAAQAAAPPANQVLAIAAHADAVEEGQQPSVAVPRQLLVRFKGGVGRARQQAVLESGGLKVRSFRWVGARKGGPILHGGRGEAGSVFNHLALLELEDGADEAAALKRLGRLPEVLYAEPNYWLRICPEPAPACLPNDFDLEKCWNLNNTGQTGGRPDADIDAPEAWALGVGSSEVKVAVIDTGVDFFHPDLEANIWRNPGEVPGNGIDDDQNGYTDDVHGYDFVSDDFDPMDDQSHGTHVAGIIGAVGDNNIGVAGVCWRVSLMALKAFDERGDGVLAEVIDAIHYAVKNGAHVVNASWSSTQRSLALREAVAEARQAGIVFVAAAGNDRSAVLTYPAAYEGVVAVAGTNSRDERAAFSNFGPRVALAAPGETIYSTVPNNEYDYRSGTSMAAPHVAGVAALVCARHPGFTSTEVEAVLRNAVDEVRADNYIGAGRINAAKALAIETPLPAAKLKVPEVIFGRLSLRGTAKGERFACYTLEHGPDIYPTNWTRFYASTEPVEDGVLLEGFSTAGLGEGVHTIRLTVTDTVGQQAIDRAVVTVRNVCIASPQHNDVLRAGDAIPIRGTVFGPGRTYRIEHGVGWQPASWSTAGITLANDGSLEVVDGLLASWDTTAVRTNEFYTLRLTAMEGGLTVGEWVTQLVYLDGLLRPGWPQYVPVEGEYLTNDWREVTVADLDQDGFEEILRVDSGNSDGKEARLLVYQHDGKVKWERPLARGEPYADVAVVGDVDGDGALEVFVDVGGMLFAFGADGRPLAGNWPVQLEAANLGKVLADLDGDGRPELIGFANDTFRRGSREYRQLVVFNAAGEMVQGWDLEPCELAVDAPKMFPAVGNLDEEPDLEIVAVAGCGRLGAFKLSKPSYPLWTATVVGFLVASPVIGDINHDGKNEIVIGTYDPTPVGRGGGRGQVHAFDAAGQLLRGWPVLVGESFAATAALADFDRDRDMEIVIPGWTSRQVHLLHHDGFEGMGWPLPPFSQTLNKSATVVGDVNGDGRPDVVMVSPGKPMPTALTGDLTTVGGVMAWDLTGQQIDLNPRPDLMGIVMEASAGSARNKGAALTLTDLDHDGKLDIVATTIEDFAFAPAEPYTNRKRRYSIYAWATPYPCVATNLPWRMLQHDPEHTGRLELPKPPNQPPVVEPIPDQTVRTGTPFFAIELDRYVVDPDDRPWQLRWSVSGNVALQVAIDADHKAVVSPLAPDWSGRETIRFTVTDPGGLSSEWAATFAAWPDYVPPLAEDDEAMTLEDQSVEIDVLANDSDPRGYPLRVIQFSRPSHGTLEAGTAGGLLYLPAADFNGEDSFTYTVNNGRDGMAMATVRVKVLPVQDSPRAAEDRAITWEDTPVTIDVLANDTDADGDGLSITGFTQPTNGAVSFQDSTNLLYVPKPYFNGTDKFAYQISDGQGAQATGEVIVMVKPVNNPPVAQDQAFVLNRNSRQNITYLATDPDGDELSFTVVRGPDHGELWTYPKVATYYPKKGYVGSDSFTYRASDGLLESQMATVELTMLDQNNAPEAESQSVRTKVGQALAITLKATDADDDPLSFLIFRPPTHGSLTGSGTNYIYTPDPAFLGDDEFTYLASDGSLNSPETAVRIRVTDQNTAPVAVDSVVRVRMNTATELTLVASDGEGDPLTYAILAAPAHGRLEGVAPNLMFTPDLGYLGPDRLVFKVSDGELESEAATVLIRVVVQNREPVGRDQDIIVPHDQSTPLHLDLSDEDGDPLRCVILKGPAHGRLAGLGTNYVYTPAQGYVGPDSFTYRAWDGQVYSRITKVTVTEKMAPPPVKPVFQGVVRTDEGQVQLTLNAQPGRSLHVHTSTNLIDWVLLVKLVPTNATITVTDTNSTGTPHQFYRAVQY